MQRRALIRATAGALAAPRALRAQSASRLHFTPQQDLVTLDPVTTTAYVSRNPTGSISHRKVIGASAAASKRRGRPLPTS